MSLRDRMARDALALVRSSHHGESVTLHVGDAELTFLAVVDRKNLEQLGTDVELGAAVRVADVFVPFSSTAGATEISVGDELTCVLELGKAAVRCRISEIVSADEGGWMLRVRR